MSMPNIPNINPEVNLEIKDTISMLLSSIALEEIGLSHIINAEAEKIQYAVGTLDNSYCNTQRSYPLEDILKVNKSVDRTLRGVLQNQLMLQMKLQDTIDLYEKYLVNENSNTNSDSCIAEYINGKERDR